MKKIIFLISFAFITFINSQSWALPPCPSSGYFHNCFGVWENEGFRYEGEWKNNKKNGLFSVTYPNGDKFFGEYTNNKRNGQGTYTYANGDKYLGEYKNGKKHEGTYTYAKGHKYIGEYKDGKRHGQGIFTYPDGTKDVGEFKNEVLNGFAIRYDKYGNILKEGIWKDDKFLYSKKKSTPSSSNSKLDGYKNFCEEIGFTLGTEKFGECVMKAMEKG